MLIVGVLFSIVSSVIMRVLPLLLLLLGLSLSLSFTPVSARVTHKRFHHQGESLSAPEDFLSRLDLSHFSRADELEKLASSSTRAGGSLSGNYSVGCGIADVTGQVAEVGFMGYAMPGQKGAGLLQRLRSRAFIFVENQARAGAAAAAKGKTNGGKKKKTASKKEQQLLNRVVYVSIDLCMGFQLVKNGVIDKLAATYGPDLYTHQNVLISGTHTHATPGGIGGTVMVDITTLGFVKENYEVAVDGIYASIVRAHNNIQPAVVKMNVGQCDDCNYNRSPSSYLLDPDAGKYANNTDHEMTVLRVEATNGTEIGMLSFFAVHGTSLNNTNMLVSGDNK